MIIYCSNFLLLYISYFANVLFELFFFFTACPKNLRIIKGECSSNGNSQLIYLLQRPQHCRCVWQKLTDSERQALGLRPTEACKCRPSFIVKQCHEANNNQTAYLVKIYTKYILQQGECHIERKFEKNPVVCQVGSQLHR